MQRTTILAIAVLLAATGCSSSDDKPDSEPNAATSTASSPAKARDAGVVFTSLAAKIPTAKRGATVTAENDPNHLLGRPGQYTSKITFTDTRIKKADTEGLDAGDVSRGGAIETFTTPDEAQARTKYIQTVIKGMPALAEYDYVHGASVIRVSHLLTPAQAGEYQKVAGGLP
ncbi:MULTISPECIES: hypothetical protein [unclassified Streptomyces]|uniref:hypothetical protein n=1 Tax=unclassified Streptomyces TaxID=2593676 RepID=UPI0033D33640